MDGAGVERRAEVMGGQPVVSGTGRAALGGTVRGNRDAIAAKMC